MKRIRLDTLVVERFPAVSKTKAQALIMAGQVLVAGLVIDKPGKDVPIDTPIELKTEPAYVSRAGAKLEAALDHFEIDPGGLTVLDAGASTGGFTHCLLKRGAARVIAVDVGYGIIHWNLRSDPRVVLLERTNIRYLTKQDLPYEVQAATADLSFISLRLVLPVLHNLLPVGGWIVPLVKPQFEVGKADVGKGVVRDPEKIRRAVDSVKQVAYKIGFEVLAELESPVKGTKGNSEWLLLIKKI